MYFKYSFNERSNQELTLLKTFQTAIPMKRVAIAVVTLMLLGEMRNRLLLQ